MSEARRARYAAAFYEQACSDWQIYVLLVRVPSTSTPVPRCHPLHYLQMACEKLAKAYRLLAAGANVDTIATRHVGFAQFINEYLRSPGILASYKGKNAAHKTICKTSAAIAREIENSRPRTRAGERRVPVGER